MIKARNNMDNLEDVPPPDNPTQIREEDINYNNITSTKGDTDQRSEDKNGSNIHKEELHRNAP